MISPTHRENQRETKKDSSQKTCDFMIPLFSHYVSAPYNEYRAMLQPTCLKIVLMCRVFLPTKITNMPAET